MGTSNFHNVNANCIFAVDCDDDADYFWYDDLILNLHSELGTNPNFRKGVGTDEHELRSYPSKVLGSIVNYIDVDDIEVEISIVCVVRSGYYSGVNLDWDIVSDYDKWNCDDDTIIKIENLIEEKSKELVEFVENIYTQFTDKYEVVARFSNGETIYEKI